MKCLNSLDNETKAKLAKEVASAACQVAAIVASFAVGKRIEHHYGVSERKEVDDKPKKFWQK